MEYLNVYDNNKNLLDKKVIMQKTSPSKSGKYSSTGGHVTYGESSYTTIIRETQEELGLDISKDHPIYINTILLGVPFCDIYYLKKNINIDELTIQTEEVSSISYMTKEEILALIEEDNITKSHGLAFKEVLKYKANHEKE